jgi:hypothetical protein
MNFQDQFGSNISNQNQEYLDLTSFASNQLVNSSYTEDVMMVQVSNKVSDFGGWGGMDDVNSKKE